MNLNALALAALLPLILGVPSFDLPGYVPQMTGIESSLLLCENGHLIDGTNKYEFDITNLSETYIDASSITIDNVGGEIVLLDKNAAIAPNEKMSVTFLLDQVEAAPENISDRLIFAEGYVSTPAKCEFADVQWVSCEKIESTVSEAYKYTFLLNPFNYTGTEDIIFTIEADGRNYSFHEGKAKSDEYHYFILDKEIDMDTLSVTDVRSLQMTVVNNGKDDPDDIPPGVGAGFLFALGLPFLLMGTAILGGIALLTVVIVIIIRSIIKRRKLKKTA